MKDATIPDQTIVGMLRAVDVTSVSMLVLRSNIEGNGPLWSRAEGGAEMRSGSPPG